jgi:hypothetical protein
MAKKDGKGRNNINKKDHQLKFTSMNNESKNSTENKMKNQSQNKNSNDI